MKLSRKMLIVPSITLGIFIFLGFSGHRYISLQHSLMLDLSSKTADVESLMTDTGELRLIHANLYKILSWYNTGYEEKRIQDLADSQDKQLNNLVKRLENGTVVQNKEVIQLLKDYGTNMKSAIEMASSDLALATTFVNPCEINIQKIDLILAKSISDKKEKSVSALENASKTYRSIATTGVSALLVSIIFVGLSGYSITRVIENAIKKTIRNVERMAGGDLTQKVGIDTEDELGRIAKAVDSMGSTLGVLVRELHVGAEMVVGESGRLSNISASLVDGVGVLNSQSLSVENSVAVTTESIADIESAATGMNAVIETLHDSVNNINSTISAIAGNSQRVFILTSKDATGRIDSASEVIMELNEAIQKINKITEIIKEISEQTNLLALNATIEAVRAGEYGKGFGVVANEVKNLARQTSVSATEISSQVSGILSKSNEAVRAVSGLSEFMQTISEISLDVSKSIEEEKLAIEDITASIAATSLTSKEIAGSVANSLEKLGQIKKDVDIIYETSDITSEAASQIKDAVLKFNIITNKLKKNIDSFKI